MDQLVNRNINFVYKGSTDQQFSAHHCINVKKKTNYNSGQFGPIETWSHQWHLNVSHPGLGTDVFKHIIMHQMYEKSPIHTFKQTFKCKYQWVFFVKHINAHSNAFEQMLMFL